MAMSDRTAEPGPGLWTVTDLDSRLAVNRGRLEITGTSGVWDRTMMELQTPFVRHKGRYLEFQFTPDANNQDMTVAWQRAASGLVNQHEAGIRFGGGGFVLAADGPGLYVNPRYPYSAGVSYVGRIYDGGPAKVTAGGSNDWYYYVRPDDSDQWSLIWRKPASPAWLTQVYAALNNIGHSGTMDYVRIRESSLLLVHHFSARPVHNSLACADADAIVECLVQCPESGTPGLVFRYQDSLNYWKLEMNLTRSALDLSKVVAGVTTRVGSRGVAWQAERQYLVRAVLIGDAITTFVGRQIGPGTNDAFNQTALLCGVLADAEYYNLRADVGGELLW